MDRPRIQGAARARAVTPQATTCSNRTGVTTRLLTRRLPISDSPQTPSTSSTHPICRGPSVTSSSWAVAVLIHPWRLRSRRDLLRWMGMDTDSTLRYRVRWTWLTAWALAWMGVALLSMAWLDRLTKMASRWHHRCWRLLILLLLGRVTRTFRISWVT